MIYIACLPAFATGGTELLHQFAAELIKNGASPDEIAVLYRANFQSLHDKGMLQTPDDAAARVLAWMARPDFGANPVADVREA